LWSAWNLVQVSADGCAADNLLINCSFERNTVAANSWAGFFDSAVDGWSSRSGKIELLGNGFEGISAHDGENFLEIDEKNQQDGMYQSVMTNAGQEYVLSFYLRARRLGRWDLETEKLYVEWNGVSTKVDGYSPASTADWTRYEATVVGTGGMDTVELKESTVTGANDQEGPIVDLVQLQPKNTIGGGGGDPHFKTWSGKRFDYHGACDLVLVDHPSFDNGKGLRIHIRTTRRRYYSFIESSVLQIGDDILQYSGQSDWVLNGKRHEGKAKITRISGYVVRIYKKALSVRLDNKQKAKIDFQTRVDVSTYVAVDAGSSMIFKGSRGLLGEWETGKMLSRDGTNIVNDPDLYAREWQVRALDDPVLFEALRVPVYPDKCLPPNKPRGNRLGEARAREEAERACANWGADKEDCIFDVIALRDTRLASTPWLHDRES